MNIGDKVRFLNTTGGGTVKGFQGKDIVLVEDEDGFDVPVLIRECVIIGQGQDAQVKQHKPSANASPLPHQATPATRIIDEPKVQVVETKEGEQLTVCLAYLPNDIKSISSTSFESYLVNDSNYFLSYTYLSKKGTGWICRNAGVIEPNTKLFIDEFAHDQLNDMERICLQFVAYKKEKEFELKNAYSADVRIDTVKFYKMHSFRENDYFDEEALVYPIVNKDLQSKELKVTAEELEYAMKEKKEERRPRIQPLHKKEKPSVLEIDLHINELLDNTNGLTPAEILEYQLSKFNEILSENLKNRGQKIVFIHGKGDGVLKNAILKELKDKYKKFDYQDASFREYGYGATMVTIK